MRRPSAPSEGPCRASLQDDQTRPLVLRAQPGRAVPGRRPLWCVRPAVRNQRGGEAAFHRVLPGAIGQHVSRMRSRAPRSAVCVRTGLQQVGDVPHVHASHSQYAATLRLSGKPSRVMPLPALVNRTHAPCRSSNFCDRATGCYVVTLRKLLRQVLLQVQEPVMPPRLTRRTRRTRALA